MVFQAAKMLPNVLDQHLAIPKTSSYKVHQPCAHAIVHDDAFLRSLLQSADACVVRSVDSTELTVLGWLVHVQLDALQEIASTAALRVLPLLEAAGAAATSSAASASANASVMMTTTH
jgi:hypothetical protein